MLMVREKDSLDSFAVNYIKAVLAKLAVYTVCLKKKPNPISTCYYTRKLK